MHKIKLFCSHIHDFRSLKMVCFGNFYDGFNAVVFPKKFETAPTIVKMSFAAN